MALIMHVHNLHDLEYITGKSLSLKLSQENWIIHENVFSGYNINLEMLIGLFCF